MPSLSASRTAPRTAALALLAGAVAALATVASGATAAAEPAVGPQPDEGSAFSLFPGPTGGPNTDVDGDRLGDDLQAALDAGATEARVLVSGVGSVAATQALGPTGPLAVHRELRLVPGFVATVTPVQARALAVVPGTTRVELDGETVAMDAAADRDFGLSAARRDALSAPADGRLDGTGAGLCVVDTGVSPNHEQLAGRPITFTDLVGGRTDPYDDNGHGTHVAGTALGDPTPDSSPAASRYGGVAGGAPVFVAKALAGDGTGRESDAVAGVEWCVGQQSVRVVLLPLGSAPGDGGDLLSRAVDAAAAAGKVVIVAAGNGGDALGSLTTPAGAAGALAVGAVSEASAALGSPQRDEGVHLAPFSSRGATAAKPDLVAPGVTVMAAAAGTTEGYVAMSGTSMAAAYVAGVVALGLERVPEATPAQVALALRGSAADRGPAGPDPDWGAGILDVRGFLAALAGTPTPPAAVPSTQATTGTVEPGAPVTIPVAVPVDGKPLAATLLVLGPQEPGVPGPPGAPTPDLDLELYDPTGALRVESRCPGPADLGCGTGRQETVGVAVAEPGTWQLVVTAASGTGSGGAYALDVMAGPPEAPAAAPAQRRTLR